MKQLIKITLLAAAVAFAWTVQPGTAAAEKVRSTRKVKLMSRPGEKSRVVKRVPSGKTMKVLEHKGRWVKVRVGSESGWVTRTSVRELGAEQPQARKSVRKSRRRAFVEGRSKRRGWSDSAPEDRIGSDSVDDDRESKRQRKVRKARRLEEEDEEDFADEEEEAEEEDSVGDDEEEDFADEEEESVDDEEEAEEAPAKNMIVVTADEAEVYAKPTSRSKTQFVAQEGDKLYFVSESKSGKWVEVENDDGETGWVKATHVQQNQPFEYARKSYAATGGLGYTALGMSFASDGAGQLANYQMSSAAASIVVGGEFLYAGGSKTRLIGADLQYRGSRATPGIRYDDGAGNVADIAFTMHEVDVGASYGYRFDRKDGLAVFGRAGYHYGQFQIRNVEDTAGANLARLPSELLRGFTVGARVSAPRLTKTIGASLEAEYLVGGARTQTVGLEDGATSRVMAAWAIAQVSYQWKSDIDIVGGYRYFLSNTEWAGVADGSMRTHNATQAKRKDVVHTVSVGVGKKF